MQPINKIIVGIVEDDHVFGNHFREQLAASPHVIEARLWSSAEEFSQMDLEPMPDILFIDINLPGSNGIDLASKLTLQLSEIKKIIITSLDTDENCITCVYTQSHQPKPTLSHLGATGKPTHGRKGHDGGDGKAEQCHARV